MKHLFFDCETFLFSPGNMAPRVVCLQYCRDEGPAVLLHARADRAHMLAVLRDALRDPDCTTVGHNVSYDLACMANEDPSLLPLIFAALADNRVTDTIYRQKLADISRGRFRTREYNLGACAQIHDFDEAVDKEDLWRLRYGELAGVPLDLWPEDAKTYALRDALATRHVYQSQAQRYDPKWYCDEFNQTRKFFCLRLIEVWGIRTDRRGVESLRVGAEMEIAHIKGLLVENELVRADGSRNMTNVRARIKTAYAALGKDYPRPKQQKDKATGKLKPQSLNPACDNDACEQSDDEVLRTYASYSQLTKVLSNDVVMLERGIEYPIHTHFDIVESGRTSSASPNIQNPRRLPGVRECFVPRPGMCFISNDYSALELRTVAQVCKRIVGFSKLGDMLNTGRDPHTALAAQMLGLPYADVAARKDEPAIDNTRTAAKGMNFGFPGGLGAKSFPAYAWRAYKIRVTEAETLEYKRQWLEQFPEFKPYHRFIGETYEHSGVTHLFSNRMRGRVTFTSAANSYFQGLGADAAGEGLFLVCRACFADPSSVLYGSRPVNFMHDDVLNEIEPERCHEGLIEQGRLMNEGASRYLPDVPPKTDGKAMWRWSKVAKQVTHNGRSLKEGGIVIPWMPEDLA